MENSTITYLFDKIGINNSQEFETFIEELNEDQALYIIYSAIEKSHSMGVFNLSESELLSKSLRMINKNKKSEE